jgi:hypothetical protein
MGNHFHFVVETPQANLVAGMKWFLGTYTSRFNRRHKLFGHLFSGRYKALVVDGSGTGYLRTVCDYVHLNPVRARLLAAQQPLRNCRWSSYGEYLKGPGQRTVWQRVDRLFGEMGIPQDSAAGRRQLEAIMEEQRRGEEPGEWKAVRRGWCLGGGGADRGHCGAGGETAQMGRGGTGQAMERRPEKSEDRGAIAWRSNDNNGVDRETAEHGRGGLRRALPAQTEAVRPRYANVRDRPFMLRLCPVASGFAHRPSGLPSRS